MQEHEAGREAETDAGTVLLCGEEGDENFLLDVRWNFGAELRRPEWLSSGSIQAGQYRVDPHFAEAYNLTVTKGRFFRKPVTDESTHVVINEAAAEQMNLDRPVGATLEWTGRGTVTVIGVVENFNAQNARAGIRPVVLRALTARRMVSVGLRALGDGEGGREGRF